MTRPARFTQSDLERVFKAAKSVGVRVAVKIDPDGSIMVQDTSGAANDSFCETSLSKYLRENG